MRLLTPVLLILTALAVSAAAFQFPEGDPPSRRLPNGRVQSDAIRDDSHRRNIEDLEKIIRLATDVKKESEKNKGLVLDLESLKKLEEIGKLSESVRKRMKRP